MYPQKAVQIPPKSVGISVLICEIETPPILPASWRDEVRLKRAQLTAETPVAASARQNQELHLDKADSGTRTHRVAPGARGEPM